MLNLDVFAVKKWGFRSDAGTTTPVGQSRPHRRVEDTSERAGIGCAADGSTRCSRPRYACSCTRRSWPVAFMATPPACVSLLGDRL